jgi:hypothetical protein
MTTQCEGIKKDGNPCSRNVKSGKYCYQHIPVDSTESKPESKDEKPKDEKPKKPKPEQAKRCCCCKTKVDLHMKNDKYYCGWHYPSTCNKCGKEYTILENLGKCPRCVDYVDPKIECNYKILEIIPGASKKEIRTAYLKLSMKWHPDKCDLPEAKEMFQKINNAYEILYS